MFTYGLSTFLRADPSGFARLLLRGYSTTNMNIERGLGGQTTGRCRVKEVSSSTRMLATSEPIT